MRPLVAVIAVLVIGWLAVLERDARLYDRGIAAGGSLDDPATIARAEADMRDARLLNPTRRQAAARRVLEDVLRAEPDNLSAWDALDFVNGDRDPALKRRAAAEIRRLDPLSRQGR